ncbi:MAG TPA: ABC transporter permease [Terriglobia bacterium]|nr:ABC transporter permease [Terriglobia bacterium]
MLNDLRFALRMLRRNPVFTALTIFTMALAIGANSAIFSVINTVLLCPLPFKDPASLVAVWDRAPQILGDERLAVSYPNFLDWNTQNHVFERAATFEVDEVNFAAGTEPENLAAGLVSSDFFSVLGVNPVEGRTFRPAEFTPGANRVALLSFGLWQRCREHRDDTLGLKVRIDGNPYTVIGIMPADFKLGMKFSRLQVNREPELWVPQTASPTDNRGNHNQFAIARLKSGVTLKQAQADLAILAGRLARQYPDNEGVESIVIGLHESLRGEHRTQLMLLLLCVVFVLLIACGNVANLLLGRAEDRKKEVTIRVALGASRARLIRQLLTETTLLSLIGGSIGLLVVIWSSRLIDDLLAGRIIGVSNIHVDSTVVGFTLMTCLFTGVLFGLAPALRVSHVSLVESLKQGNRTSSVRFDKNTLSKLLVILQIGLSLGLLVGAGLIVKSFLRLCQVEPGFRRDRILTLGIPLNSAQYPSSQARTVFYQRLLNQLSLLPEVESVGMTSHLPTSGAMFQGFLIEGRPYQSAAQEPQSNLQFISPQYLKTLGIPLQKGRIFTNQDTDRSPSVVIISQGLARRYWGNQNPLGSRIHWNGWRTIVGVVGDVKQDGLAAPASPQIYLPFLQFPSEDMKLVVQSKANPMSLAMTVKKEVQSLDPNQPVSNVRSMEQVLAESVAYSRLLMGSMGTFGIVALVLSILGIYGVISHSVIQRTHEIGIRIAVGARPEQVLKMTLLQGLILILAGVCVGLVTSLGVTHLLASRLFGVTRTDPMTFAEVILLLTGTALLACFFPARRAAKVDPMVALRYE